MSGFARRIAIAAAVAAIAGCATTPQPSLLDDDESMLLNRSGGQTIAEAPPIEPVEPPEPEPLPAPAPTIVAPPVSPTTIPPPAVPPVVAPPVAPPPAPATAPQPEIPLEDLQMIALLGDLNRYGGLSADDVKREIGIATQALTKARTDHNRIRLAVLYTLTRAPTDDQR